MSQRPSTVVSHPLSGTQPSADRTMVAIRERSFLDILDLALVVVRRRPVAIGIAATAGIAPFAALNAWLLTEPEFPIGVELYLLMLEAPWATAPLTVVLGGLMFGERPSAVRVLKTLARSSLAMVLYHVVVRGLLIVSVLFYPLIPARLAFLNEVILLERGRWWAVVRRNAALCGHRGGELFGQWLAQIGFGSAFVLAFWLGTGKLIQALTSSELTWDEPDWADLRGLRFQATVWLAVAFFGVARFLTYIDQRIRLEGWEVELRLRSVGRAMEEPRRW